MPFPIKPDVRRIFDRFSSTENDSSSENSIIEKQNLVAVFKLIVKDLLDSSLKHERLLEQENFPLKHFFIALEHILLHGFTGRKTFSISSPSNRKDPWLIIEIISNKSGDVHTSEISMSSKEMTNIHTSLGRVRAWLRLALMQKRLADYFKILIEQKNELKDLYENDALLLSDESMIISGLLLGLNVLDFNFCLREAALDYPTESAIHYSLYLRERRLTLKHTNPPVAIKTASDEQHNQSASSSLSKTEMPIDNDDEYAIPDIDSIRSLDENKSDSSYDQRLSSILDQKHYLEELNRNLKEASGSLQKQIQTLEQTNKSLVDTSSTQKTRIEQLQEELTKITSEKDQIQSTFQRKIDTLLADMEVERETFQKSRTGFDVMYNDIKKKYDDECLSKQKIESVYQNQLSQNNEFVESTKIMENDIATKTVLYDRLKEENSNLAEKLQTEINHHNEAKHRIQMAEKENKLLRQTINELETNIEQINNQIHELGKTNETLSQKFKKLEDEKTLLKTDLDAEQDLRDRLQKALSTEKEKVSTLQFDIHELNIMKQEYESYKKEMIHRGDDFDKRFREQVETITELSEKLGVYMTREADFREKLDTRPLTWVKDEHVKACFQCKKDFNALRRKHHCRNCGQIFCEPCVSTKLALPGTNKPERVCEACVKTVLAQCAVNN